jgi:hypothetical protein
LPADQGFHAVDAPGGRIDLGLVVQHEFLFFQRLPKLVLQRELFGDPLGHLLRVEEVALAARLGLLQGGLGVPEQRVGVGPVVRKDRNSRPRRNPDFVVRYPERVDEVFGTQEPLVRIQSPRPLLHQALVPAPV